MTELPRMTRREFGFGAAAGLIAGTEDSRTGVLTRDEAGAILPATVFFRGQSATLQARNSSGLRFGGGRLVLTGLVDTSGYSSGIAEKYQAYLITELALRIGDQRLLPGCYGYGFLASDRMVVMDIGANDLMRATTQRDAVLKRPTPLQILVDGAAYRLYLGRSYVSLMVEPAR